MTDSDIVQPGWHEAFYAVNGVTLHVVEAGLPGAPLLLLLHGFPEFWWAWRKQLSPFAAAGYHVVALDMRGYNLSDAPQDVSSYRLNTLAADVVALADVFGAERFHLVGHDWGAVTAWWTASQYAERIHKLVAMSGPHPDVWFQQALTHPTQALRSAYVAVFQLPWLPEAALAAFDFGALTTTVRISARAGAFEPGALERYKKAWSRPGRLTAMLHYYRALRERRPRRKPDRIEPPTLVVWAGEDSALERHVGKAGCDLCDDGRLLIIEHATHWLHLEQPDRVNAAVIQFLGRDHG